MTFVVVAEVDEHKLVDRDANFGRQLEKKVEGTIETRPRSISAVEGNMATVIAVTLRRPWWAFPLHLLETL